MKLLIDSFAGYVQNPIPPEVSPEEIKEILQEMDEEAEVLKRYMQESIEYAKIELHKEINKRS